MVLCVDERLTFFHYPISLRYPTRGPTKPISLRTNSTWKMIEQKQKHFLIKLLICQEGEMKWWTFISLKIDTHFIDTCCLIKCGLWHDRHWRLFRVWVSLWIFSYVRKSKRWFFVRWQFREEFFASISHFQLSWTHSQFDKKYWPVGSFGRVKCCLANELRLHVWKLQKS